MNANELADLIDNEDTLWLEGRLSEIATMLRHQQAEIEVLKQIIDANNLSQNIGQFVKPANEPVAWTSCLDCGQRVTGDSIHTCSPQLKTLTDDPLVNFKPVWQEKPELTLTDEEIDNISDEIPHYLDTYMGRRMFARAILIKAQEK